ncbi:hypothetical protein [Streptomyces sp. NPDC088915]|uniref:hypothetical protein n=1 Tax=Streptomyces sp. NPDC088915 TaxID=3365912 RepID=UPI003811CB16
MHVPVGETIAFFFAREDAGEPHAQSSERFQETASETPKEFPFFASRHSIDEFSVPVLVGSVSSDVAAGGASVPAICMVSDTFSQKAIGIPVMSHDRPLQ